METCFTYIPLRKVVGRVIDRRLRSSDIFDTDEQHFGFQPGKSTFHYLYKLYNDILAMKNLPLATIYDLEKAFDSVDQSLLLSNLINNGLNGPMLATIKNFSSNRKVSNQVNDYIDMSFFPLNGLPQGGSTVTTFVYILSEGLPPRCGLNK